MVKKGLIWIFVLLVLSSFASATTLWYHELFANNTQGLNNFYYVNGTDGSVGFANMIWADNRWESTVSYSFIKNNTANVGRINIGYGDGGGEYGESFIRYVVPNSTWANINISGNYHRQSATEPPKLQIRVNNIVVYTNVTCTSCGAYVAQPFFTNNFSAFLNPGDIIEVGLIPFDTTPNNGDGYLTWLSLNYTSYVKEHIKLSTPFPLNNTNTTSSTFYFNITSNNTYQTNITLNINNSYSDSVLVSSGNNNLASFTKVVSDGSWYYNFFAYQVNDTKYNKSSLNYSFYVDSTLPNLDYTNLTNGTFIKVGVPYTMTFQYSDNLMLWGSNLTINGGLANFTQNVQSRYYNLTITNNSFVIGQNNISLTILDAHTALETTIKTDDLSKVGDSLKVKDTLATSLTPVDKITYLKETDRFTFCYYPVTPSNTQKIQLPNDCYYQNREDLYEGWMVCPKDLQWWDFDNKYNYKISVDDKTNTITAETSDGKPTDKFCFNSVGTLNTKQYDFYLWGFNESIFYYPNVIEGSSNLFILSIIGNNTFNGSAILNYNNTLYATTEQTGSNYKNFSVSVTSPSVFNDTRFPFFFNYTIVTDKFNSSYNNQTVTDFLITTNCSSGYVLLNLSLKDEETQAFVDGNNSLIEVDLQILKNGINIFNYSIDAIANNLTICIPNSTYSSNYSINFIASYVSAGYVKEFYYLDNGSLTTPCLFNGYTDCHIDLFDLLSADSTTFLFKFFDANGLSVDDAIIHTYRKYIGDGLFREVERSKEDNNGETHIHLVEEDVIYYFMVTQYGDVVYTSNNYNAKCLSTPCSIELKANNDFVPFPTSWDIISGVAYSISTDKSTRMVTTSFVANSTISLKANVYKYNNNVATLLNTSNFNGTSGSFTLYVPNAYGNSTFFIVLYKNNSFLNNEFINLNPSAKDVFGLNGVILGALLVMAVGLMCVSEGVILIIGCCLALFFIGVMFLIDLSWVAIISIISAGSIIIWKLTKK